MKRFCAIAMVVAGVPLGAQERAVEMVEWRYVGADQGASKHSPLADINASNVGRLEIAWEWQPGERPNAEYGTRPGPFQAMPLMIENVLYVTTMYNRVVALDAETGAELWAFDPRAYRTGSKPGTSGYKHRGVAIWGAGDDRRIFINARDTLYALDAANGRPVRSFGENGRVLLTDEFPNQVTHEVFDQTSPPVVFEDLVIIGSRVPDQVQQRFDTPGSVQAFDVLTGERRWVFYTIPQSNDDFGADTWEDGSWRFTGHANVWGLMSLDADRGLLYIPTSTPSSDYYGGRRLGANLFAESLVCLDARTGERVRTSGRLSPNQICVTHPDLPRVDVDYTNNCPRGGSNADFRGLPGYAPAERSRLGPIPLTKPPYAKLVAIDLDAGDIVWSVPFGEGSPAVRNHPLLADVALPDRLGTGGSNGPMVTAGGLVFIGGGDPYLYAFDAATGREVSRVATEYRTSGNPMTYRSRAGRQFILIATGGGTDASLVALSLPPE